MGAAGYLKFLFNHYMYIFAVLYKRYIMGCKKEMCIMDGEKTRETVSKLT